MSTNQYLPIHENIKAKLHYFYETQKIPHLIFHGSPGTGKRTLVYDFLNKIYGQDKHKLKTNVMFVNCAHGKGIISKGHKMHRVLCSKPLSYSMRIV